MPPEYDSFQTSSIHQKYKDRGVRVVGIDPGAFKGGDDAGRVQSFAKQTGVTFPVGLDLTNSYGAFTAAKGISPFPLDVIIGKDGRVAYVRTEYVASEMQAVIEDLLAK